MGKKKHEDQDLDSVGADSVVPPFPLEDLPPALPLPVLAVEPPALAAPPAGPTPAIVTAQIFARVSGLKAHQLAGFLAFATRARLTPRSVEAWRATLKEYQDEPIG